jgi:hypothetical protein
MGQTHDPVATGGEVGLMSGVEERGEPGTDDKGEDLRVVGFKYRVIFADDLRKPA